MRYNNIVKLNNMGIENFLIIRKIGHTKKEAAARILSQSLNLTTRILSQISTTMQSPTTTLDTKTQQSFLTQPCQSSPTRPSLPTRLSSSTQPLLQTLQEERDITSESLYVCSENRGESSVSKSRSENRTNMHTSIQKAKLCLLNKDKDKWLDINRKNQIMERQGNRSWRSNVWGRNGYVTKGWLRWFSTALSIAVAGVLENLGITVDDATFLPEARTKSMSYSQNAP